MLTTPASTPPVNGYLFAVECKASERNADPALFYFAERTGIPKFFQVHLGEAHFQRGNVTVLPFRTLCQELGLP
jgi:hypothetical protein